MIGLIVRNAKLLNKFNSSSLKSTNLSGIFCSKFSLALFKILTSSKASLSRLVSAFFLILSILLFKISKSDRASSKLIISMSLTGSTVF